MQCPACKAENTDETCRRCRADLGLLFQVERQRARALGQGWQALAHGRSQEADRQARSAQELRKGPDARRLQALAALLSGDFSAALENYQYGRSD